MPLVRVGREHQSILAFEQYSDERELRRVLWENPALLMLDGDSPLLPVQRDLSLPGAGLADLFFVDTSGRPVVVEVKLIRNPESRRAVLAQVFDCASALSSQTIDALDEATEGRVDAALRRAFSEQGAYGAARRALALSLRAGAVRFILAVDDVDPEHVGILRFLNDHSDLDVRLLMVRKHRDGSGDLLYASAPVVAAPPARAGARKTSEVRTKFQAVLDAWNDLPNGPPQPLFGRATYYRQIKIAGWPAPLHYEFVDGQQINTDVHLEHASVKSIAPELRVLADELQGEFEGARCEFDPLWQGGCGRLCVRHEAETPPRTIAMNMARLIRLTRERVEVALQSARSVTVPSPGSA